MKLLRQLLVVLLALIGLAFIEFLPAAAATNRVLLVYDSQNSADHGYRKIDSLQRLLTSHQLSVRTIAESQYRSGMLRNGKYSGVITMVNWAQNPVNNRQFQHDWHQFSGIKLHIGGNLTKAEADQIGGAAETLRHQQLILSDAHGHSQLLPLSDTLTVFKPGKQDSTIWKIDNSRSSAASICSWDHSPQIWVPAVLFGQWPGITGGFSIDWQIVSTAARQAATFIDDHKCHAIFKPKIA